MVLSSSTVLQKGKSNTMFIPQSALRSAGSEGTTTLSKIMISSTQNPQTESKPPPLFMSK